MTRRRTSPARYLRNLWRNLIRRRETRDRIDDELQAHLTLLTDEKIAAGMAPSAARHAAHAEVGSVAPLHEHVREARAGATLEAIGRDVRHALRLMRRAPGFTFVALLTLALGIGANAAIFQLIDVVLLRALPVERPDQLVDIHLKSMDGARGSFFMPNRGITYPIWREVARHTDPFTAVFAWAPETHDLANGGEFRPARVLRLSSNALSTLGVLPEVGQLPDTSRSDGNCGVSGVVLSDGFWQSEYARDPAIVGRTITLSGKTFPITGVTPSSFSGLQVGSTFDVIVPLCAEAYLRPETTRFTSGTVWWLNVAGRLKSDWTADRASAYLQTISPPLFQMTLPPKYPSVSVPKYLAFTLQASAFASGLSPLRTAYTAPLFLLSGIAALVLLTACGNIANLLLAQATTREREMAVRLALGASRRQLIRQALVYSLLLAALGAAAGVLVARVLSQALVAMIGAGGRPVALDLALNWRLVGFTALVALITCLLFGIAPALRTAKANPTQAFGSARGTTTDWRQMRLRRGLVAAQVAFSLVLLVTALLFVGTFRNLLTDDVGFGRDRLLVASFSFGSLDLPVDSVPTFRADLLDRLRALPGVDRLAETDFVPLSGRQRTNQAWLAGDRTGPPLTARMATVGASYFGTVGTPLLRGREFDSRDGSGSTRVAIVNETFARQAAIAEPVGRTVHVEATPTQPESVYQIVGLVKDAKYSDIHDDVPPVLFIAASQEAQGPYTTAIIRTSLPTRAMVDAVRQTARTVNPRMTTTVRDYAAQLNESFTRERLMAFVSAFFGGLAALLAAIGLYGVMSHTATSRRREIGLRLALGATRREVVLMVVREGATLTVVGLVCGVAMALLAARSAGALLFGLSPSEPMVYAAAIGLLAAIALLATALPALRSARLDPAETLRDGG